MCNSFIIPQLVLLILLQASYPLKSPHSNAMYTNPCTLPIKLLTLLQAVGFTKSFLM